jgi:DNA polymerase III alpha subunit (gram-positive type)
MSEQDARAYLEKMKDYITDENRHRFEGVANMMRNPMSVDEMRAQCIRNEIAGNWYRKYRRYGEPLPLKVEVKIQRRIKKVLEHGYDPRTLAL